MRAYLVTTFIGCFGLNDKNEIISFRPFPKDPVKIAKKLKISEEKLIEEEKGVIQELREKGYKEFVFPRKKKGVEHVEKENKATNFIKQNLRKLAIKYKFVKDQIEFNQLLAKISVELARVEIKKAISKDKLVIQTIRALEEIEKTINVFAERIREWYSLHFPEMDRAIKNHEKFVKIVEKFGLRGKIKDPELSQITERSMGADFKEEDIRPIQIFARKILELYELRKQLTKYLEKTVKEIAPNFSELAGPILAAKLISRAGSIEKLARMSSSSLQLLGAEKALFRYLHGRGKPPKHGLIFAHPLIQRAPSKKRGKIARILASKLSMAIKIDFFSGEYKADKLKAELEERIKEALS
jgi:nucleolar protein 56